MRDLMTPIVFDTALVPEQQRFLGWSSALNSIETAQRGPEPFEGRAEMWMLESLVLSHVRVDAMRYLRDEARIATDLRDHFAVVHLIEGSFVGDYGHGEVASAEGSVTAIDMRRPWWTDATRLHAHVLSIPRAFLIPQLGDHDPHGIVVEDGLTPLLAALLSSVVQGIGSIERRYALHIARTVRDMLAETLLTAEGDNVGSGHRDEALLSRARAFIDEDLTRPLDVTMICNALNASRSKLYRAFGGGGGIAQEVQRRRLQALRTLLADPGETRSIAELAPAVGFGDKSQLTRTFKREYGCTPGEYRARGSSAEGDVPVDDVPQVFKNWTNSLS